MSVNCYYGIRTLWYSCQFDVRGKPKVIITWAWSLYHKIIVALQDEIEINDDDVCACNRIIL